MVNEKDSMAIPTNKQSNKQLQKKEEKQLQSTPLDVSVEGKQETLEKISEENVNKSDEAVQEDVASEVILDSGKQVEQTKNNKEKKSLLKRLFGDNKKKKAVVQESEPTVEGEKALNEQGSSEKISEEKATELIETDIANQSDSNMEEQTNEAVQQEQESVAEEEKEEKEEEIVIEPILFNATYEYISEEDIQNVPIGQTATTPNDDNSNVDDDNHTLVIENVVENTNAETPIEIEMDKVENNDEVVVVENEPKPQVSQEEAIAIAMEKAKMTQQAVQTDDNVVSDSNGDTEEQANSSKEKAKNKKQKQKKEKKQNDGVKRYGIGYTIAKCLIVTLIGASITLYIANVQFDDDRYFFGGMFATIVSFPLFYYLINYNHKVLNSNLENPKAVEQDKVGVVDSGMESEEVA